MVVKQFVFLLIVSVGWSSSFGQEVEPRSPAIAVLLAGHDVLLTPFASEGEPMAEVRSGEDRFAVPAGPEMLGQLPDLKANIRVIDGYLLVHSECACTKHGASISRVFAIRGGRLKKLGVVTDDWDKTDPNPRDFSVLDNQLEGTRLASHAAAPNVIVPLHERAGQLLFDPSRCWKMNSTNYEQARLAIEAPDHGELARESMASDLLEMISVDKYCGRRETMEADFAIARKLMAPDDFAELSREISGLVVGQIPND